MLQYIFVVAAVVVVVGVAILGIVLLRRRASANDGLEGMTYADSAPDLDSASGPAPDPDPPAHAEDRPTVQPAALASTAPAEAAPAWTATMSQPVVLAVEPVPYAPNGNGSAAALLADPLGVTILDIADGRGKLTSQELKRLEVFRPDRLQTAIETVQLPPELEDDDSALMRLAQMKLYAATLELRTKWALQMTSPAGAGLPDTPFSARDFKLKMARDVMALPTSDRSEVIGFLLGGLLNTAGSGPELKRAVIDTLEHLHSIALVNVLLDCLDDPDPIVQDYALAAADRLLEGS
jgi:hypothetical protein